MKINESNESISYDKNYMKEKKNDLVSLHKAIQEKLKTALYSEQIRTLTLVPDKWSRMYCSKFFNVSEYLVWTSHEIKKVGEILAKHVSEKGKTITTETPFIWWQTSLKMTNSVSRCLKRKTLLVWVKET